jgi:hypothetical protein
MLAGAMLLAGCSAIRPHVYSDRLLKDDKAQACPSITLDAALVDANQAHRRYIQAAEDQGNGGPTLGAALLGLSSLAIFKGATGGHPKDLAGAAVVGGAGLAYSNTFLSRPRLAVYRAGADALSCAMTAVTPLVPAKKVLGEPTDRGDRDTLYGRRLALYAASEDLRQLLDKHAALNKPLTQPAADLTTCKAAPQANCAAAGAGLSAGAAALAQAKCKAEPKKPPICTVERNRTETRQPSAKVQREFAAAEAELARADAQRDVATAAINSVVSAGPALCKKAEDIQLAVDAEIDKTVPDTAAILAAAQGIRDLGLGLTGVRVPAADKTREAQGGEAAVRKPEPGEDGVLQQIADATARVRTARIALDALTRDLAGGGEWRKVMNDCSFKTAGVRMQVFPAGDSLTVAAGSTLTFFVASPSGKPSAVVVEGPVSITIPPAREEGALQRLDFKPPADAPLGAYTIRISDGSGLLNKLVQVAVTAPAAAPAADTGRDKHGLTVPQRERLKLQTSATDDEVKAKIAACQQAAKLPAAYPADEATRKAIDAGTCSNL